MKLRTLLIVLPLVAASFALTGCLMPMMPGEQKAKLELQVDPAPATMGEDVAAFLVGYWSPGMEVSASLPGVSAQQAADLAQPDVDQYWQFLADGTLTMHTTSLPQKVGGTWQVQGNKIMLTYTTYGGKPLDQARQELQAGAESGRSGDIRNEIVSDWLFSSLPKYTELVLAEDKKSLEFVGSASLPGMEALTEGEQQVAQSLVLETLTRMKPKK